MDAHQQFLANLLSGFAPFSVCSALVQKKKTFGLGRGLQ